MCERHEGVGAPSKKGFLPHAGKADDSEERFLSRLDGPNEGFGFLPKFAQMVVVRRPLARLHERDDGRCTPQKSEAKSLIGERLDPHVGTDVLHGRFGKARGDVGPKLGEEREDFVAQVAGESAVRRTKACETFKPRRRETSEGFGGFRVDFALLQKLVDLQAQHFSAAEGTHARRIEVAQNLQRAVPVVGRNRFVRFLSDGVERRG